MNRINAVVTVVAVGIVVKAVKDVRDNKRQHQLIREEIKANSAEELVAIQKAALAVQERINNGHRYASIHDLFVDLKFEKIAAREF